ncbi:ARM repeat superfamily protein [Striga asiatica]|uniref:ARM repeat superfamily protein n=1 Tax=Striga asiatica TaxID=4170 RepID=A0A5A7PH86_STRAF|nr:ARM repeat superfamily protein [Striga asiatica]
MSEENRKPTLNQAILLISSLISITHSIRIFTGRWNSIRSKLEELLSNLSAVGNCDSGENLSLSIAVDSILATLRACDELARRCLEFSYSGKLRTQSDLDILAAKLDGHAKSLSDIYAAGLLTQSYAIVVLRPSVSASKDDMKFYVNDLLSRLKIGCREMKKQALTAFNEAIQDDERYVKIAVEIDGFVNSLVNLLDSGEVEIREEACRSASLISDFGRYKPLLIGAGVIPPLIRVLESGNQPSRENAARCLIKVTENSDNAWSVSAHGGVTALLKICRRKTEFSTELIVLSCRILKNLVGVDEIKKFIVEEEGAISTLIELIKSKDEPTKIASLNLIQAMAYRDSPLREKIACEGGIRALVRILDPKSTVSNKIRELAFKGITSICFSSENSINVLINYSFIDHILYFLTHGEREISLQESALKAAFWLCGASEEAKKVMGETGLMPVLVKFLDSKSFEIREIAGETLSSMLSVPKNRKKFVEGEEENFVVLLRKLDPKEENGGNKKLLLSILVLLAGCSGRARKKMVRSGYLRNVERLAEEEDESDAKKIVRRVSTGRLKGIWGGLWHS